MRPVADAGVRRSPASLALLALLLMALFAGFVALGSWQVQRRAWKLELIARVEQRVHAQPLPAPGRTHWPAIGAADEYLRVHVDGAFLHERAVFVQAVTERGPGYWLLAPLQTREGFIVLVNRGFVEADRRAAVSAADAASQEATSITGLLRLSEPKGGFLRRNDPAAQRWFSRDVAAIAAAQALPAQDVAPYFIDADADADADAGRGTDGRARPIGGMTVLRFHNSHLIYAITWYALALLVAAAAAIAVRQQCRLRRRIGTT